MYTLWKDVSAGDGEDVLEWEERKKRSPPSSPRMKKTGREKEIHLSGPSGFELQGSTRTVRKFNFLSKHTEKRDVCSLLAAGERKTEQRVKGCRQVEGGR